jgi:hypothetical protein
MIILVIRNDPIIGGRKILYFGKIFNMDIHKRDVGDIEFIQSPQITVLKTAAQ